MVPDPLARQLSVSYGATTVGGANEANLHLDGPHRVTRSWNHASVEFECVVTGTSEPDFAAKCVALESAFSDPDHALIVAQGAQVLLAYAAAPKDWCRPTIVKRGDPADSGRSRRYTLRVDVDPAATQFPTPGLREVTVDVAYSPARRRTVTISGVWTAIDGTGSRAAYEAGVEAFATAALGDIGGTYELADEPTTAQDRPDHLLAFRRVYLERLWSEGGAALDDPDIVRQSAVFRRRRTAPGDSLSGTDTGQGQPLDDAGGTSTPPATASVKRPTTVDVTYSVWIDTGVTDLVAKWDAIRDWLMGVVASDFGLGAHALTEESPSLDYDENRISASLVVVGMEGGDTLEQAITVQTSAQEDQVVVPAWTGDPYSAYAYDGPRVLTRTVSMRAIVLGSVKEEDARARLKSHWQGGTSGIDGAAGGGWTRGTTQVSTTPKRMGMLGHEMDVTEVQGTITRRFFKRVTGGGGGTTTGRPAPRPATTP